MINGQSQVRPGGSPYVSPEGIIHGTDLKYRWAYETTGLRRRCLLFTLDENRVSCSRVKGRATADEVTHAFTVWVGGQSQPALRFDSPKTMELSTVRRITANRTRGLIRLNRFTLLVSSQQFDPILGFLHVHCPQAAVQ
ncbi:MAG: hypothetical protein E7440_02285 [Ruminococcaceae bacterium]|nr:hypothetical protein [Oscillospiraceae bacterium]